MLRNQHVAMTFMTAGRIGHSLAHFALCIGLLIPPCAKADVVYSDKQIATFQAGDGRQCVFFTLTGVAEAVPALPNVPWFALSKTHPNYKENYALLLAAKLSGRSIGVVATGALASCGHAEVAYVYMQ